MSSSIRLRPLAFVIPSKATLYVRVFSPQTNSFFVCFNVVLLIVSKPTVVQSWPDSIGLCVLFEFSTTILCGIMWCKQSEHGISEEGDLFALDIRGWERYFNDWISVWLCGMLRLGMFPYAFWWGEEGTSSHRRTFRIETKTKIHLLPCPIGRTSSFQATTGQYSHLWHIPPSLDS